MRSLRYGLGFVILSACSDMKSRPETADKLKPILVTVNAPTAAEPTYKPPLWGDTVRLDFHLLAPSELGAVTATPEVADATPLTLPAPLPELQGEPEVDRSLPGLQHIVVHATVQLPTAEVLAAIDPRLPEAPLLRFRYGLTVSEGGRSIPISGDFPAYRTADAVGASWNLFGSDIVSPEEGATVPQKLTISSQIVNPQDEPIKIGWFVSAGEIKNRRASETEWELPGAGSYTLIFTIRGKNSRSAAIGVRSVVVP